jgi:hypothetical protein
MAICVLPSFEIPGLPVEPPLHGLIDTAYVPDLSAFPEGEQNRWEAGIAFLPNPATCGHVQPWLPGTDDPADKADPDPNVPFSTFLSFNLTYSVHCHVSSDRSMKFNIDAALAALEAGTSQAVEAVFWGPGTGGPLESLSENGNFTLSGSSPLVTGYDAGSCQGVLNRNALSSGITAFSAKQALLALTQALGNCALGARGFIHAPVYLVQDWAEQGLIKLSVPDDPTSKFITSVRGDYIVGGSGYPGTGPDGHPVETPEDGYAWAYASGPVGVLLSKPQEKETTLIDHTSNLHRILVERTVAIAANDTCLFSAYVDVA